MSACANKDTETAPHRMGAALTYARRYALFALVGIAGEDDLDAPDAVPAQTTPAPGPTGPETKRSKTIMHRAPMLDPSASNELKDAVLIELSALRRESELLNWAQLSLPKKNTLTEADAQVVEAAYKEKLRDVVSAAPGNEQPSDLVSGGKNGGGDQAARSPEDSGPAEQVTSIPKELRKRDKAHLLFVRSRPCLVCKQSPCDAHHLKFAQQRALGRKVSDEFTVPLCRAHHQELHRHGNEKAWWANLQITPLAGCEGALGYVSASRCWWGAGQQAEGRRPGRGTPIDRREKFPICKRIGEKLVRRLRRIETACR